MRVYDNGSLWSVSLNANEIYEFTQRWPASGLRSLNNLWAQFEKRNGDLVDLQCNRRSGCHAFDGEALSALIRDAQCAGAMSKKGKAMGLDPATQHCSGSDPETRKRMGLSGYRDDFYGGAFAGIGLGQHGWRAIELPRPIPGEGLIGFTPADARRLANQIRPYIGKTVLLYGGGGMPPTTVRLTGVKVQCREKVCAVIPSLRGRGVPSRSRVFEPFLGSWRLAVKG